MAVVLEYEGITQATPLSLFSKGPYRGLYKVVDPGNTVGLKEGQKLWVIRSDIERPPKTLEVPQYNLWSGKVYGTRTDFDTILPV